MTTGKWILSHRQALGLSQSALAHKLSVDWQRVSLWEDELEQPSDAELTGLEELFGERAPEQAPPIEPDEEYHYGFTRGELDTLWLHERDRVFKKPVIVTALVLAVAVVCLCLGAVVLPEKIADPLKTFGACLFLGGIILGIWQWVHYSKFRRVFKAIAGEFAANEYCCRVYDGHFVIERCSGEERRKYAHPFSDVNEIRDAPLHRLPTVNGKSYVIPKSVLEKDSFFYRSIENSPPAAAAKAPRDRRQTVLTVMFVLSLLSIFIAMRLASMFPAETAEETFRTMSWSFFATALIPLTSLILGLVFSRSGCKYIKNIVAGAIMTLLLVLWGIAGALGSNTYSDGNEPVLRLEQYAGVDIPEPDKISTMDMSEGSQSADDQFAYYMSTVIFDDEAAAELEASMADNWRWMSSLPNDFVGIASIWSRYQLADYVLIVNTGNYQLNSLPGEDGSYNFIMACYNCESRQMTIVEYKVDYVK